MFGKKHFKEALECLKQSNLEESKHWTQDYPYENGKYQNMCRTCEQLFFGYKHRRVCRNCFNTSSK